MATDLDTTLSPARRRPAECLPPLISTSDPGSFALDTLRRRVPIILRETIDGNAFDPAQRAGLEALYAEIVGGVITPLADGAPDAAGWNRLSAPFFGRSWLAVPWYWAEAYFYRRILAATGYFQPGPGQGFDPFAQTKAREWAADAAPRAAAQLLAGLPHEPDARFAHLLHASLWGNRIDLSYTIAAHLRAEAAPEAERANLLVDHTAQIWRFLLAHGGADLGYVVDNAGTELLLDLALIDFLLTHELVAGVRLYLKPQPFFVSDALAQDVVDGLDALLAAGGTGAHLARRIDGHIVAGELTLATHPFFASGLQYDELPDELWGALARHDGVIFKGDANYRRLVGDRYWPHDTPFAEAVRYFPAPLAALRTLKSEVLVGLAVGDAERLTADDPAWLVNGRRGVIQARL